MRARLLAVQARLDESAGQAWRERGELSDADNQALDAPLAASEKSPDAGGRWERLKERVQAKLRP